MKKRVLSMFMALALCLTLLPAPVWAEETENNIAAQANTANVAEVTINGKTTPYTDIDAAFAAAQQAGSATVKLLADVTISHDDYSGIALKKGNITLDLNGYVLSSEDSRLVVESGASLTVTNADAKNNTDIGTDAGLNLSLFVQQGSKFTCTGGKIAALALQTADSGVYDLTLADETGHCTIGDLYYSATIGANEDATVGDLLTDRTGMALYGIDAKDSSTHRIVRSILFCDINRYYSSFYVGSCTDHLDEEPVDGTCSFCGTGLAQDGDVARVAPTGGEPSYVSSLQAGFDKLKDAGGTLCLLKPVTVGEDACAVTGSGAVTLDLNGHTVDKLTVGDNTSSGSLTVRDSGENGSVTGAVSLVSGTLTVESGTVQSLGGNGGTATITGGSVKGADLSSVSCTVTGGSGHCGTWQAGSTAVTVTGGAFGDVTFANPRNVQLTGGSFEKIAVSGASAVSLSALLANGYAFYSTSGAYQSAEGTKLSSVQVQKHTHNIDTDGKCTECGAAFGASVTARVGGASDVSYYDTIDSAFTAAHEGDTVTLLADITSRDGSIFVSGGPYTLDLNGHRIDASGRDLVVGDMDDSEALLRGELTVKDSSTDSAGYVQYLKLWNGDLTVESGNFHQIIETGAGSVGTITITGGTAEDVTHTSPNVTFQLSGGTFKSITISSTCGENVFPSDLLADGYAYASKDNPSVIQNGYAAGYSAVRDVTVVEHKTHTWDENGVCACGYTCSHTAVDTDGKCTVCKKPMAAMVTKGGESRAYAALNDALSAADGGTVKLLADAGGITISSPLKLDLNGKTAEKLTVTGDVTLASLLPEGYAFKSGSTWISDLSSTELTNVSMAKIPIKSMDYPTEMSMTYGGAGTLLVNVAKETGTGAVSFQWYKVEGGKATAVGSATASNRFDLAAQKLPAGNHTFRFSATCDGYEKMSEDIAVTVQKASISASRITPPTAQENLIYTGHEQALITAGSVTDYGTMQYSLTENGTYSQDIPTGTDAGAYTVWYRVIGDANHNDTAPASVAVSIGKKPLTITKVACAAKIYDGTTNADIISVTFDGVNLNRGTDYTVTASFDDAGVSNGKNITATVTLMEQTAKNYALEQSSFPTTGSIIKAAAPDFTKETALVIVNGHEKTYTVTLPTLPTLETPKEYGAPTYELGEIKLNDGYYTSGAKVENGELTLPIQKNDVKTTDSVGTVTVVIKSTNYNDITLTVNVNATNKLVPTVTAPTANALTYNGTEQALVTAGQTTGGTMLYRLGDSEWSEQLPTAKNAGEYTVWYKVQGNAEYADVAEQNVTVTVARKAVTVTALDKSAHTGSTAPDLSSPKADKDYKVEGLLGADTLSGTVTLTYEQTPDMSKTGKTAINITGTLSNDNYEITYVHGTLTVSNRPSSGGGSSSDRDTSGGGTVKTETTKNNDGSVTKTETKKDGTVIETTTGKDGSTVKTTTNPNGSSVTETKAADGSTGTVKTDKNGNTEAETKVSAKAVEDAKKSGEAVKAPVEVEASRDSSTAPTVKVELPKNSGDTKVEIPVTNVKPGTVAVLVHADGTEEIVKNSLPTADGIQLTVNGGATVKIVDNSKDFIDTRNHWAKDAIDFVSARGLVSGMSGTTYAPDASTTRAQLWTILARQNNADLTGGATWFENAQNWAKEKGISDGTNPNGTINRAQMVTMLWRAMGQPTAASGASFADVPADSYYAQAVAWAIENGITAGVGGGRFDPNSACTRGQIATFLYRYMK